MTLRPIHRQPAFFITLLCAGIFMGVKYQEYSHKFHDGLLPGKYYTHQGARSQWSNSF